MNKTIKIEDILFNKIKNRYRFYDIPASIHRTKGIIVDSYYPFEIGNSIKRGESYTNIPNSTIRNTYAISDRVAEDTGASQLHISELISMLNYTKTDISKLLQSVKNKKIILGLIGLGGSGSNFLHWTYKMSEWVGKDAIFETIIAYDDDTFDVPNMLRIPWIPEFQAGRQKTTYKTELIPLRYKNISKNFRINNKKFVERDEQEIRPITRTILYGAPDIETRLMLSRIDTTFIAATHRDDEFSLVENPKVDTDIMIEAYGKINLSKFFINHLAMTIKFLESIRDREEPYGGTEERRIEHVNFNVKYRSEMINGFKAGAKRIMLQTPAAEDNLELEMEE